jgi:hypothetical protein
MTSSLEYDVDVGKDEPFAKLIGSNGPDTENCKLGNFSDIVTVSSRQAVGGWLHPTFL